MDIWQKRKTIAGLTELSHDLPIYSVQARVDTYCQTAVLAQRLLQRAPEMKPTMDGPHSLGLTSLHAFLAVGMTHAQSKFAFLLSKLLARAMLCTAHRASYTDSVKVN